MLGIFKISRFIFIGIVEIWLEFTDIAVFSIIFVRFFVIPKLFLKIRLNTFEIRFVLFFYSLISNILSLKFKCFSDSSSFCTKLSLFWLLLPCCFSPFKNFKVSSSDVEDEFSQVDLVLIDPNLRDYDEEQNRVKVFNFEIGTYAWQRRTDTVFWTESIILLDWMISFSE